MKVFRRALYLTHRWLGIGMGLLMASWCLSGIVMLWHTWPQPDEQALSHIPAAIQWPPPLLDLHDLNKEKRFQAFRVSMAGREPVLTLYPESGHAFALDLRTGRAGRIPPADAASSAARYAKATGAQGLPLYDGLTTDDQWVLDTHGRDDGFYRFVFPEANHTQVYVSSVTGDVMQATTRTTRLWAWAGAIPHWLYPAVLRKHPFLWQQVVIVLSGTGVFLTVTGIWVGILRLRRRPPFTPYRGWQFLHHISGTVFGLFALLWVTTGFLTMSPGGLFQSDPNAIRTLRVTGTMTGANIQTLLTRLATAAPPGWIGVKTALLGGHVFIQAETPFGPQRLDETLSPAPLTQEQLTRLLRPAGLLKTAEDLTFLTSPDAYYFSRPTHKRPLPVWRAQATDGTLIYLDGPSGMVQAILDQPARQSRWLVYGFHDLDFWPWLRASLTHWAIALPLLCGVACVFLSGVLIGLQRLRRKLRRVGSR